MRRTLTLDGVLLIGTLGTLLIGCPEPPTGQTLTVKNYLQWCSVSVNGAAASSTGQQVVNVDAGTVPLVATPLSGFELGATPWHNTDNDHGSGDPGTRSGSSASTTITLVGTDSACVWVCCETVGQHDCPPANQCP